MIHYTIPKLTNTILLHIKLRHSDCSVLMLYLPELNPNLDYLRLIMQMLGCNIFYQYPTSHLIICSNISKTTLHRILYSFLNFLVLFFR